MRQKKVKIKSPYFLSVARDSHLTNKPVAINARILPPSLSISAPFYGYLKLLKATRKGRKSKEGFVVTSGNRTRDIPHRRSQLTNRANPSSFNQINSVCLRTRVGRLNVEIRTPVVLMETRLLSVSRLRLKTSDGLNKWGRLQILVTEFLSF